LRAIESVVQGTNWRVARQTLLARLVPSWRDDPTAVEPYWRQYFGDGDSFFYRVLARTPGASTGQGD
ncbi:MAG: hypothetical protein LBC97_05210, partial [Bifidobacteriaceae bacterium]|nr:hypothetical protein [Bifidobacteriaceae bacterium]